MREDAADGDALLQKAIESYADAFKAAPGHYYSGINAATLMHVFHHLTAKTDYIEEAEAMAGGVRWSASCEKDYWAKATLGDLEVLTGTPDTVKETYKKAIACAENDWFALNSTLNQLCLLDDLAFRQENVKSAIDAFQTGLRRLKPAEKQWQPRQIFLFSGHMVDSPNRTQKGLQPRFPLDKVAIAEANIAKTLEELGVGWEDLAFTQGASGGDLIFAEACLDRGVKLQLLQPFPEPEFIECSVAPADGDWRSRFYAVKTKLDPGLPPRCMPQELGESTRNPYEHCNLWLLYTALSYGPEKVTFICLWNGEDGDGPGGTAHMKKEVIKHTGKVVWLDTRKL